MVEQLFLELGLGIGMGALIALIAFVAGKDPWNNRLFIYTTIIGAFTSLAVIEGIEGGVGGDNLIKVVLMIAGLSFFANKGIQLGANLRNK
jgi:hypothetical protein